MLTSGDIKKLCPNICCGATLYLQGCAIGRNEEYMRELSIGCNKITKVCGYTKALKYIPGTNNFPCSMELEVYRYKIKLGANRYEN